MLSLLARPPRHPTPPIHLPTSSLFSIPPPHEVSPLSLMFSMATIATAITTAMGGMATGSKAQTMMMMMAMATAARIKTTTTIAITIIIASQLFPDGDRYSDDEGESGDDDNHDCNRDGDRYGCAMTATATTTSRRRPRQWSLLQLQPLWLLLRLRNGGHGDAMT
jgi:hypothetical protein